MLENESTEQTNPKQTKNSAVESEKTVEKKPKFTPEWRDMVLDVTS